MIGAGADVNGIVGDDTPLTIGCQHGHLNVVQKWIKSAGDVNLNNKNYTQLIAACLNGHLDVAKTINRSRR